MNSDTLQPESTTAVVTDLATLPLVLTIEHMMAIYGEGKSTIQKKCAAGTFRPAPFAKYPWRWRRADVEAHLNGAHAPTSTTAQARRNGPRRGGRR